ncbi:MAG: hypothetical protein KBS89_07570 [Bacteroidales bacterium]|nr:hypothetical protein [Candidatus Egerieousia equi]
MTRAKKAQELASQIRCTPNYRRDTRIKLIEMAEWESQNPSDETIMLILNCIGYEEKSWIEFVRKELEKRKEI